MGEEQDMGVAASPPGCQPSASAASADATASSQSGIPNAVDDFALVEFLGDVDSASQWGNPGIILTMRQATAAKAEIERLREVIRQDGARLQRLGHKAKMLAGADIWTGLDLLIADRDDARAKQAVVEARVAAMDELLAALKEIEALGNRSPLDGNVTYEDAEEAIAIARCAIAKVEGRHAD